MSVMSGNNTAPQAPASLEDAVMAQAESALEKVAAARASIGAVIFGQEKVVEETLVTLISGGHGLLVGVPGLAKTKLVDTLGTVLGLDTSRVQFTPRKSWKQAPMAAAPSGSSGARCSRNS